MMSTIDCAQILIDLIDQNQLGPVSYMTSGPGTASVHLADDEATPATKMLAWSDAVDDPKFRFTVPSDHPAEVYVTVDGKRQGVMVSALWAVTDPEITSYLRSHDASEFELHLMVETGVSA